MVLQVVKVVLVQCNLVDNQYHQKFEVLYSFTPNQSYSYLLHVEASLVFLKLHNNEFDDKKIAFMDQNGRLLEREDKVNLSLLTDK